MHIWGDFLLSLLQVRSDVHQAIDSLLLLFSIWDSSCATRFWSIDCNGFLGVHVYFLLLSPAAISFWSFDAVISTSILSSAVAQDDAVLSELCTCLGNISSCCCGFDKRNTNASFLVCFYMTRIFTGQVQMCGWSSFHASFYLACIVSDHSIPRFGKNDLDSV